MKLLPSVVFYLFCFLPITLMILYYFFMHLKRTLEMLKISFTSYYISNTKSLFLLTVVVL